MMTYNRVENVRTLFLICFTWLAATAVSAETTTTTTTTTNPDGTTTVEETTTTETPASAPQETEPAPQEATSQPQGTAPNVVGPDGATGVIRRSDRRQDRRAGDPRLDYND